MAENRPLYFVLGVLVVVSLGAIALQDDGIAFADGSLQTTAWAGFAASGAVQGKTAPLPMTGVGTCSTWETLYTVPADKRLVVEWLAVQGATLGAALTYPMDLFVRTYDGLDEIIHPIVRLEDGAAVGIAFFTTQVWSGPVRLYSEEGHAVDVRLCIDLELAAGDTVGTVSFSGYLIDI